MTALPRLKPAPVPAIHPLPEYLAEGQRRSWYEDTKRVLQVPWMGVVTMAYAHYPTFYDTLWQGVRDLCASRPFIEACQRNREFVETEIARLGPAPIHDPAQPRWNLRCNATERGREGRRIRGNPRRMPIVPVVASGPDYECCLSASPASGCLEHVGLRMKRRPGEPECNYRWDLITGFVQHAAGAVARIEVHGQVASGDFVPEWGIVS